MDASEQLGADLSVPWAPFLRRSHPTGKTRCMNSVERALGLPGGQRLAEEGVGRKGTSVAGGEGGLVVEVTRGWEERFGPLDGEETTSRQKEGHEP